MREGCGSGCDRCPPCPKQTTPTPTTLTLTSNGSEVTFSLGAGLVGYVATGVLLALWLGLWLATKADWVEVRMSNPPSWFPLPRRDSGGPAGPSDQIGQNATTAAITDVGPVNDDNSNSNGNSLPPDPTVSGTSLGPLPSAPWPASSVLSGPPSYRSFYSAAQSTGEAEPIYEEPDKPAAWV